ncbi:MAG: hypothetical protein AVDCRST_MAG87-347, partial [uncultured Thermomicrobiales bacterium]
DFNHTEGQGRARDGGRPVPGRTGRSSDRHSPPLAQGM